MSQAKDFKHLIQGKQVFQFTFSLQMKNVKDLLTSVIITEIGKGTLFKIT